MSRALPLTALLALAGCGVTSMNMGAADVGITPGGSQDIGYARDLIAQGQIPHAEHFTAEGLFSEHDLPLSGETCEALLCPRTAATIHRPADGADKVLVQLGFGTNIDGATFERDDQDLVLLVDTSGSMTSHLELAKEGMIDVVEAMGPADRVGLVEFGSRARVVQRSRAMDAGGREALIQEIRDLETNGSTDMESGMREAYDQLSAGHEGRKRLLIFSDAQPNTGLTAESDFVRLVRSQAGDDVGTTFFGLGPNLGTELADVISKVRGGSFHFLTEDSRDRLFEDELDFLLTPVAYDLEVEMRALEGSPLGDEVWGAPVDGDAVAFGASTLFLSSRNGGMAATFDVLPDGPLSLGTMEVSYLPVDATERVTQTASVRWEGGTFHDEADDVGVYKIDALVHEVKALNAAHEACEGTITVDEAHDRIAHAWLALGAASSTLDGDGPLAAEAALMTDLDALLDVEPLPCAPADVWGY